MVDFRYPVRVLGPLAPHVPGFQAEMVRLGYSPRVAQDHAYVLAHLSRWVESERLTPQQLTSPVLQRFTQARRADGYRRAVSVRYLKPLLTYLRQITIIPGEEEPQSVCPVERVLSEYRGYLEHERRLDERTAGLRVHMARRFLTAQCAEGGLQVERLEPAAVIAFISAESARYAANSMRVVTTSVRSLLRYLFLTGLLERDLTEAVPSVAGWQKAPLPSGVNTSVVDRLLGSCDRSTPVGRRDFAVLMLMARLGLRAQEVAGLRLDDIDWRAGELVIRGKGGRVDRLPLPADVGAALADYLRHGRRRSALRAVFMRSCGPDAPLSRQSAVMVSRSASTRAGIPTVAGHQLRHRLACQVLAQGGSLAEIAQLLRHHSEVTTAIYAKVDRNALAAVVRPWPKAAVQ